MFDTFAGSERREWAHDRTQTIGASEAFQCLRRNFFMKRGFKADIGFEESYGATTRGSLLENHYVVPALRAQLPPGANILWAGDDQITLIKDRLSATPDGLITGLPRDALKTYGVDDILGDEVLIEIKSFDSRLDITEPKPIHVGQTQQQFGLVHEMTNHRPEYAVILYVNASWLDDIRPFVVKRDPAVYEACKTRADMVYGAKAATDLQPEGKIRGGSECAYCPFQKQCSLAQVGSVPASKGPGTLARQDEVVFRDLVSRERAVAEEVSALKAEQIGLVEQIKDFLRQQGSRFAKTSDGYSASYTVAAGRKTYDVERIAEDTGIDLEDYAKVGDPGERLTVRAPKE